LNGQSLAFDRADVLAVVVHGNAGGDTLELSNTAPTIEYTADGGDDTIRVLAGTLTLGGADVGSDGGADGGGVRISVAASASVVFTSDQHLAGLTLLGDATAWIAGDVGASFMLVVGDLALDPAATLDVGAGAMIVHNLDVGWADGSGAYGGLTQYVASAYQFGAWTGPGLTSRSAADSDGLTGVGIGLASSILGLPESDSEGAWRGESVNGNSVLITYAYAGDADLNGYVDAADYGLIDNFVQFPGTSGYFLGDFNFDGIIDASDYGVIDNSIQLQGPPLA
jgi:hypothetical protein